MGCFFSKGGMKFGISVERVRGTEEKALVKSFLINLVNNVSVRSVRP